MCYINEKVQKIIIQVFNGKAYFSLYRDFLLSNMDSYMYYFYINIKRSDRQAAMLTWYYFIFHWVFYFFPSRWNQLKLKYFFCSVCSMEKLQRSSYVTFITRNSRRRNMAGILPIRRKTQNSQSINYTKTYNNCHVWFVPWLLKLTKW